ncbi:Type V secretory pathway, adhesin AidA [Salinivirga cyanobacteriivorans]|uniref:Type V secretory pathway, adhesin AidA n=1 Tax=Salinivirga cyanobacteriivorans TaxID=1307839 RepID=A0A0S2I412_9BACT|nr:T9SS type A sorting domain-containing protein [Salinivirga cyanobacteriivorans]ALO17078.1 Type V secretory pathway, adhesin AidA [Salinivirga cyanobacteriivorans]
MIKLYYFLSVALIIFSINLSGATYTSTGDGDFYDVATWGGGLNLSDIRDGSNDFIIAAGHTVVLNDSVNINDLTINGTLIFGDEAVGEAMVVNGVFEVNGSASVSSNTATHKLYIYGGFISDGTIDFRNNSNQVVNTYLDGTYNISGTDEPLLNSLNILGGSVTLQRSLNIDGNLLVDASATFNAGANTINLAGNFTSTGNFNANTSTLNMDAGLVQSITQNVTLYDFTATGSGIVSLSGSITVTNDFTCNNSSRIVTSSNQNFEGDFTVDATGEFTANDGVVSFDGANQAITLNGAIEFDRVDAAGSGTKTIAGSLVCNDNFYIRDGVTVTDGAGQTHYLETIYFHGTGDLNFSNKIVFNRESTAYILADGGGIVDLGTAAIDFDGRFYIGNGGNPTTLQVNDDIEVLSDYIVIEDGSALTDVSTAATLKLNDGTNLYVRGADNFPGGFATYDFHENSFVRYDQDMAQTVRGNITYGHLYLRQGTKTVDGPLIINSNLYVIANNNDSIILDLVNFDHRLRGHLNDNSDDDQFSFITASGGTFYMDGVDDNQNIYCRTPRDTAYKFNNLSLQNPAPTQVKQFRIIGNDTDTHNDNMTDIVVVGDFSATNSTDNPSLALEIDFNNSIISNNADGSQGPPTYPQGSGDFELGDNVKMLVSGSDNFLRTTRSFNTNSLADSSTVRFDSPQSQTMPEITYGNVEIAGAGFCRTGSRGIGITVLGDIRRTGGSVIFKTQDGVFGAPTHKIYGDWHLRDNHVEYEVNDIVIQFLGADQQIVNSTLFPNVEFDGSGTKNIEGNLEVTGDFVIKNDITVDASNHNIDVAGNWNNNFSGQFINTNGEVTFNGDGDQTISQQVGNNSKFETIRIDKDAGKIEALSDFDVNRHFYFTENRGDFDLNDNTVNIGGNWYIQDGCDLTWDAGAMLHFNGNSEDQLIRNYNENTIYPDMKFSRSGMKRLYQEDFDINGDFIIDNASVRAEWFDLYVEGDWINTGGSFGHYRTTWFDGADQNIDATDFEDIVFSGTGTKYLDGHINLGGELTIDSLATLDVSPDGGTTSYNITIDEHWNNNVFTVDSTQTGQFIPRQGSVIFVGEWSNIYTGDSIDADGNGRAGKSFYNLVINNASDDYWSRLYPVSQPDDNTVKIGNDLKVENDFTITNGRFITYWNHLHIGGDMKNTGGYLQMNDRYDQPPVLYLEGSGAHQFDPGDPHDVRRVEITKGGQYTLVNNLEMTANNDNTALLVTNGRLDLNHNILSLDSNTGDVTIGASGTLEIDSLAQLQLENDRSITNNGTFRIVGTENGPAVLTAINGNYNFYQEGGTIHAMHYTIENTQGNGIEFNGGSIDATNNFSNGRFSNGAGNAYMTFPQTGIDFGSDITIDEVIFNEGPTYNVSRENNTGTGIITFQNSSGSLSGEAYENDVPGTVDWDYPGTKYWDGEGVDDDWSTAANWIGDVVPATTDKVILDHSNVAGSYTVDISADVEIERISIGESGANTIDVIIDGGNFVLTDNITINSSGSITQTQATDTLKVGGSWSNNGTHSANSSAVLFNPLSGTHTISAGSNDFNDFIIAGTDGEMVLGGDINVNGDLMIESGSLKASNNDIYLLGDWFVGAGHFDGGDGTVYFDKDDGTDQNISGGEFNDVTLRNSSPKILEDLIYLYGDLNIESGAFLNGADHYIYVGDNWYNRAGTDGFTQTGSGTVIFNGSGTTDIGNYGTPSDTEPTVFNNLIFDGNGTKRISNSISVNGNLTNREGSNIYLGAEDNDTIQINGTASGTFTMNGGTFLIYGADNFPQGFNTYSLTDGTVDYYSDNPQNIYGGAAVEYYNLRIRKINVDGVNVTKTASDDLYVQNQIWANDTCTVIDMDGHDLYTEGNLRLASQVNGYPPQIQWGGGRFIHEGGNVTLDEDVIEYNTIIKRGDSWMDLSVDISVTGDVTISDESNLDMNEFQMECTGAGKTFTLASNSRLYSYIADTVSGDTTYAFPIGFATYTIKESSLYYLRGDQDQAILPGVTYGNVYLNDNVTKTVSLFGDLDVEGDFRVNNDGIVLNDQGHDLYLSGYNNDLRNYTPTSTIYFDSDSEQRLFAGGNFDEVYLNNVEFSGGGGTMQLIYESDYYINGDFRIAENDSVYSNDNIIFQGDSMCITGYFEHVANTFTFNGEDQVINPGAGMFHDVTFNKRGEKLFKENGINIDGDITIVGEFVDAPDPDPDYYDTVIVQFDTLVHYIAAEDIVVQSNSTWDTDSADIYFDRGGTQYIPKIELNNIFFANRGTKYLTDTLWANDITIQDNVRFRSSDNSDNPNDIFCYGSWTNNGAANLYENEVYFESRDTDSKTIKTNNDDFFKVFFNQSNTSARTYTLTDNLQVDDELVIGDGATLKTADNNLQLGDNDPNEGTFPDGEEHTVEVGGALEVDAGGGILFDQNDMYPKLTVNGTFKVVGESGNNATLGQLAGGWRRGTEIIIESGGEVHFRYYNAEHLHYNGLVVKDGATIDPTNNFSDGIWNDMYQWDDYTDINDENIVQDTFIYMNIQTDVTGVGTVDNVTFNHPGSPDTLHHFNVYRPESATGTLEFGGTAGGSMAGELYELDEAQDNSGDPYDPANGKIDWPAISVLTWDGSESSDWFTTANWTPAQVPDATTDVIIPLITDGGDNPLITSDGAVCQNISITDGIMGIATGVNDFTIAGSLVMESDAILAIEDQTTVDVTGDWDIASDAIFEPGSSEINFVRTTGSTVITPRNSTFYDLRFSGGGTFYISGNEVSIENDYIQENGDVAPNTDNYTYFIAGNYTKSGGTFSTSPDDGFFEFNGTADQNISGGRFSRLRISNQSATVFIDDSTSVDYTSNNEDNPAFEIAAGGTFEASTGAVLYINGNVDIKSGGTFNDGGETHRFVGRHWIGNGDYVGTGTIRCEGNRQDFHRSHFNNLYFANTPEQNNSWKYIQDTVNVDNDLTVDCYGVLLYDNHVINETSTGTFDVTDAEPQSTRIYVRGENNYPNGFDTYTCDPDAYIFYDAYFDQTVRGDVTYGRLYLRHTSTKTLEGDIDVDGRLELDQEQVILDANNQNINIAGTWHNQDEGTFLPGNGEVVFDGTEDQRIYLGTSGSNDFNTMKIDKDDPLADVRVYYNDITVNEDLWPRSGRFYCYNDYSVTILGDMIAENDGMFMDAGTYILANDNPGATVDLKFNGSEVRNLTLDGQATFRALDALAVSNLFTLEEGTFDGNGQSITLGDNNDVANVSGLYQVGEGGSLNLGNRTTFNILAGGEVEVIGAEGNPATISGRDGNDYYYFNVENGGTISASQYIFEYMNDAGIYVKNGAIIDDANNFSDGTFTNPRSGGICLRIENTQSFINNDSIVNVRFPQNPGNGTKNVAKLVSTLGVLDFYSASGELAGEEYEDDNYNLINWPGVNTVTWLGGDPSGNKDWNIAANWEPSRVPGNNDNVVIPDDVIYFPVFNIDQVDGATDTVKTIENNHTLRITADDGLNSASLVVLEEFENNDIIDFGSDSATLAVQGTFTNNGTFNGAGGVLEFSGNNLSSVNSEINQIWLSLRVDKVSTIQFSEDALFKDIYIKQGKLQYTNNNRTLTSKSDFINKGEVDMAQSKLKLNGIGSFSLEPNNSQFYNLEISGGDYTLNSPQLDVSYLLNIKSGAELLLNSNTLVYGTGTTSGSLAVDGKFTMNQNSELQLRSDADVTITGTGEFEAFGAENNEAIITRNGSGRYSFVVNGGDIRVREYIFEYLDSDGLTIENGSTVDSLNNGKFSYGASGGRYLNFKMDYGASDNDTLLIKNIQFDDGADFNAKRLEATDGIVEFKDAYGLRAGHYYEDDDGSMSEGAVVWSYTKPTLIWEGDVSDRWDQQQNWDPEGLPDVNSIVIINPGISFDPVIDLNLSNDTAYAKKLTINESASLTIEDDKNMVVLEDFTNNGIFDVTSGSVSYMQIGASWANGGTFNHGGSSTVAFTSEANMDINTGGQSFYNLTLNSGEGTGAAIFSTQSSIEIEGSFTLNKGTLRVENSAHTLYVAGDFTNSDSFEHGNGEVVLNGNTQSIDNNSSSFYDITLNGTGSKTLANDMTVVNDLDNQAGLDADAYAITIQGDWLGNGSFNAQTSEVVFNGSSSQEISKSLTFYDLTINNTNSTTAITLGDPITVNGALNLTDGIVGTSSSDLLIMADGSTLGTAGLQSHIDGAFRKIGSTDFVFPLGSGDVYAPLGITALGVSSTFTAEYNASPYNTSSLDVGLNNVSAVEHWELQRSGTATPKVTLYWEDGDYSGIDDIDPLVVAYFETGTGWTNIGQGGSNGTPAAGDITSVEDFATGGFFTIGWEYIDLTWTGSSGTSWTDPANWDDGTETPKATTNIIIPESMPDYPVISADAETFDLNIHNGATLTVQDGQILDVKGNMDIVAGGELILTDAGELYLRGDLTNAGAFTSGNGSTISLNGTTAQSADNLDAYNLMIGGNDVKTLTGTINIDNNLNISGDLDAGTSTITLSGNLDLTGTLDEGTSDVTFNGTAQQLITGNKQVVFYDLTIDNSFATAPQIDVQTNVLVNGALGLNDGVVETSSSGELLTLGSSATSDEGSVDSYISGPMRKDGVADFIFPIGKNERWARLAITDMSGMASGVFEAEYFDDGFGTYGPVSGSIDHVSIEEYWDLDRSSGNAQPKVTLYWEDTAFSVIDNPVTLLVAHYDTDANIWEDMGNSDNNWTGDPGAPGYVTSTVNFDDFSPVAFASSVEDDNPLPVELKNFDVEVTESQDVKANWITLSELNNSHFILERSKDGFIFEQVDSIAGAGNSTSEIRYSTLDVTPHSGVSYYRLIQVDFDGTQSVSEVRSVFIEPSLNFFDVAIYPNPVTNGECYLNLEGLSEAKIQMVIVSSTGHMMVKEMINVTGGEADISQYLSKLASGLYSIIIIKDQQRFIRKLYIN